MGGLISLPGGRSDDNDEKSNNLERLKLTNKSQFPNLYGQKVEGAFEIWPKMENACHMQK